MFPDFFIELLQLTMVENADEDFETKQKKQPLMMRLLKELLFQKFRNTYYFWKCNV